MPLIEVIAMYTMPLRYTYFCGGKNHNMHVYNKYIVLYPEQKHITRSINIKYIKQAHYAKVSIADVLER